MSEGTNQPADKPKRPRAAQSTKRTNNQGTRRTSSKRAQQATLASSSAQEATAPLAAADTTSSAAPQALPAAESTAGPEPDEPPIGERWGEFPTKERQAELQQRLWTWEKGKNRTKRPGPFAHFRLTGADVYWLAVLVEGNGNVEIGSKRNKRIDIDLSGLHLQEADLSEANLQGANLRRANLEGAFLIETQLQGAHLEYVLLAKANLNFAYLQDADLDFAHLEGAMLFAAQMQGASLWGVYLEGADLTHAWLGNADLRGARLDVKTQLDRIVLNSSIKVADVAWNGASLINIDWSQVPGVGDETTARQGEKRGAQPHDAPYLLNTFKAAARAYRQLAIALRGQGITEAADRFTYRALIMQRKALWWQIRERTRLAHPKGASSSHYGPAKRMWHWLKETLAPVPLSGSYLFSLFLAILTGYGFKMSRIILAYGVLILTFGGTYWALDRHAQHPLSFGQALIVSITAFHGRVFSYNPFTLSDPQIVVTAIEAIFGLVIEGLFVAMLVQRFFNR